MFLPRTFLCVCGEALPVTIVAVKSPRASYHLIFSLALCDSLFPFFLLFFEQQNRIVTPKKTTHRITLTAFTLNPLTE